MSNFIRNMNILALCAFIYTPIYLYNKQINVVIVSVSFIIWFITSLCVEQNWLSRFKPYVPTIMAMILLNILFCISTHTDMYSTMVMSILAYVGVLFFAFYSRHINLLKLPFVFLLVILCLDSIDTIKGNLLMPGISRKQVQFYDTQEVAYLQHVMHIGSYPFLYSLSLFVLPITLFFKNKVLGKLVYIPLILLFVETILYGSYFISLIITIMMLILGLINFNNIKKAVISCVIVASVFLVAKDSILDAIIYIGEKTDSTIIVQHAMEIKSGSGGEGADMVTGGRSSLYTNAILNFMEHPLVGQLSGDKPKYFSMHSELLEYLEKFGLLSFPFFYIWFLLFKTQRKMLRTKKVKTYHAIFFGTLMFFLFVNPIRNEQPFTLMVFCVIPLMLIFLDTKLYNNKLDEQKTNS